MDHATASQQHKPMTYGDGNAIIVLTAARMGLSPASLHDASRQLRGVPLHPITGAAIEREACRIHATMRLEPALVDTANRHANAIKAQYGFSAAALQQVAEPGLRVRLRDGDFWSEDGAIVAFRTAMAACAAIEDFLFDAVEAGLDYSPADIEVLAGDNVLSYCALCDLAAQV